MGARALRTVEGRKLREEALARLGAPAATSRHKALRRLQRPYYERLYEAGLSALTQRYGYEPPVAERVCLVAPGENFLALFALNRSAGAPNRHDGFAVGKNCKPVIIAREIPRGDLDMHARRQSIARGCGGVLMSFKPRTR